MLIRCEVQGYFYIEMDDNATPDDIENEVEQRVCTIEKSIDNYMAVSEYDWDIRPDC